MSIKGFINFETVPWRLSRSLWTIALLSPNSPTLLIIDCWRWSIMFSIRFSLSSMSVTFSWIAVLNDATSPIFFLN